MLGSHVHEELVEVSITYPGCKEQWRSAEEREVVSFDWVSDGLCLVDKSLMDIGPCCSCPSFSIWRKLLIIAGSARSLLSSTKRSLVSSQNGLPISPMTCVSKCTSLAKTTSVCLVCSWCLQSASLVSDVAWNSPITLAISRPDTIQRCKAAGVSVRPTAPPSPLTLALFCSWASPKQMSGLLYCDVSRKKLLIYVYTLACLVASVTMSCRRTGIHLA